MPQQNVEEREARKRYVRARQTKVFAIVAILIVVALILSLLGFFHLTGGASKVSPADLASDNYGEPIVCAPANADKSPATYMQNSQVTVRVLNGTKSSGFARAVGEALQNRQFALTSVSNYSTTDVKRTTIYYGLNAIPQAYTVKANFTDATMVADDRQDALVDVVMGATFNDLTSKRKVPAPNAKIRNLKGCIAPDKVDKAKLPKAIDHDPNAAVLPNDIAAGSIG